MPPQEPTQPPTMQRVPQMLYEADQRPSLVSTLGAVTLLHLRRYGVVLAVRFKGESKPELYIQYKAPVRLHKPVS
jgi:hypothetical protein